MQAKKKNMKNVVLKITLYFLLLILTFLIYSHYEYKNIKIRTIEIKSKDIPEEFNGRKILYVADFQYDTIGRFNKKQLKKAINLINEQKKDIILLGGDYSTWEKYRAAFYKEAENLKIPEYGIYAIYGNHEYPNIEESTEYLKKIKYNILANSSKKVTINSQNIYIAGVEDLWHGISDAKKALEGIEKEDFAIFMTHNPDYFEEMTESQKERSDITLAAHTHGGQVTFFGKVFFAPIRHKEKYGYGMKEYGGHKIYITSGIGGSFLEMFIRFFAQPEIVIFELKKV
ncbi:metallophosphoesterase [Leptotrichia sp. OH3620_COT-345]|uniref:metallophosphoesterase n=1 Tax=Leptotrichia sp. OH3620_COT-345 TaxID=2491048 RepID=UPI000F64DD7F|nr:metallophosphoesterase [Leptotrichia sp. OH3620_COT-345]RRD39762.1 metallophosphoesterase [Leptotrichia sp. OH3620_COT-345]